MNAKFFLKRNEFLIILVLVSCFLMFSNLGNRYLDGDESITALLGQSIQQNGMPYAYHNGQLIHQFDVVNVLNSENVTDLRLTKENLWREQPWLYFYLEAASFSIFGANAFSARLPFVIIGILVIIFLYVFSKKVTDNEAIAKLAVFLLSTSVTFYLFSRKARYFSMIMLFTLMALYAYMNLLDSKQKKKGISRILFFIISASLLFHTNYAVFFGIISGILVHFALSKGFKIKLKEMLVSLLGIFVLTFPWYYLTESFSANVTEISISFSYLFYVLMGFIYLFVVFGFPYLFIFLIPNLFKKESKVVKNNYILLLAIIISFILFISIHNEIPPTRYLVAFLPIICLLNASILIKTFKNKKLISIIIIILLVFTNILLVFPFNFLKDMGLEKSVFKNYEKADVSDAVNHMLKIRYPVADYLYEITHNYDNADEIIVNYLLKNGKPTDSYFINTAGMGKTIMFYTNMTYITSINSGTSPDWIIFYNFTERASPRGKEANEKFMEFVKSNFNILNYANITLNTSAIRFSEIPDPIYHLFKTNSEGIIEVYSLNH